MKTQKIIWTAIIPLGLFISVIFIVKLILKPHTKKVSIVQHIPHSINRL